MADESTLNQVMAMQQQGYTDEQIAAGLAEQGISPKDINDALNKSRIKSAVYQPEYAYPEPYPQQAPQAQGAQPAQVAPAAPQGQAGQGYYPEYVQGMSTETVTEIAEQIISGKMDILSKSISDIAVFKEKIERQVSLLDERLKKIEGIIDELRISIIRKIGEYGENAQSIKEEMAMMQDSFSKVMTPLAENVRKLEDMLGKEPTRVSFKKKI